MPDDAVTDPWQVVAELRRELAACQAERDEALAQQAASAEVLQVISGSPEDLTPVFTTILDKAHKLCGVTFGALQLYDGAKFRVVAVRGLTDSLAERLRQGYSPANLPHRALLEGARFVHLADLAEIDRPIARTAVERDGIRTILWMALRKGDKLLGLIVASRAEVQLFSEREIALLQSFADQAVIAIETARLLSESRDRTRDLQESLEYQTATSDVLKLISRSTFDLQLVLNTLVETAARLCQADRASIISREGAAYRAAASFAYSPEWDALVRSKVFAVDRTTIAGRTVLERQAVHVIDVAADPEFSFPGARTIGKAGTVLGVPLLREGEPIGVVVLARERVEAFSERQIELVRTFADQAMIAIENTRLLTELHERTRDLQESLEYQTATSDVLKVISRSTFDLQPVLDTVVGTAARLCQANAAQIVSREGEVYRILASFGLSPEAQAFARTIRLTPDRTTVTGRAALERRVVHITDILADPEYALPEAVTIANIRTLLGVPLLREGEPVGVLVLSRERVEPFTERQIELVRTFADQAVIAIENTRLLTELRERTRDLQESLEYQTATSDVLKVISRSTFDLQPVLDTVVETAARLCRSDTALLCTRDGEVYRPVASFALTPEYQTFARQHTFLPDRGTVTGRAALEARVVHVTDLAEDPEYALRETVTFGRVRTNLGVPLLRAGEPIGVIALGRQRVEPYTERQIELVRTFADQAVIAIENTRLLTELRERTRDLQESLEYQTATSDVLKVISRSTFDLQPVLDTLVETAARLCQADQAAMTSRHGEVYRSVATFAYSPEYAEFLRDKVFTVDRGTMTGRTALERQVVHVADVAADPEYEMREAVTIGKNRTALGVPLLREGEPVGVIVLNRYRVEPFTERQIELVRTFADQAVIAIENTRLLTELHERTRDLQESLEYQTATSDVLKVISRSTFDR